MVNANAVAHGKWTLIKFVIPGKQIGLNEYIRMNRTNKYVGASFKKSKELEIIGEINKQVGFIKISEATEIHYTWFEQNMKRDLDNVAFFKKFINDAIVKSGLIINDNQKYIKGFRDYFEIDKDNPRVEVEIRIIKNESISM